MCGRYTQTHELAVLEEYFGFSAPETEISPRYNIAPGQYAPVIRLDHEGQRKLELMRWGLVPFWAKDESIGSRLINARSETLSEKPSFKQALKRRRCLILADGFYEWAKVPGGKQPYYLKLKDSAPFAFAGLYERWDKGEGETGTLKNPLYTFTIVTTTPNAVVEPVHERMPVMLRREDEARWLNPEAELDELLALLKPYAAEMMQSYPVSKQVNRPDNDEPGLIQPQ